MLMGLTTMFRTSGGVASFLLNVEKTPMKIKVIRLFHHAQPLFIRSNSIFTQGGKVS